MAGFRFLAVQYQSKYWLDYQQDYDYILQACKLIKMGFGLNVNESFERHGEECTYLWKLLFQEIQSPYTPANDCTFQQEQEPMQYLFFSWPSEWL